MADEDDTDDELGQVGEQMNGIENRFRGTSETSDTPGTTNTTETSDTSETSEATDMTEATGPQSGETTNTSETTQATGTTETTEAIETTGTSDTIPEPGDEDFQLREHWNGRTIYLPDDEVDDLDLRYKECSIKWQQQEGGELPKNERFYPALVRAALNETTIEAELGLDD